MSSLFGLLEAQATERPRHVATRTRRGGSWEWSTWGDYHGAASAVAVALMDRGLRVGDAIALFSSTREEWCIVDFGILGAGGVTVPLYPTSTPERVAFVLENSAATIAFVEGPAQLSAIVEATRSGGRLSTIVVIDGVGAQTNLAGAPDASSRASVVRYVDLVREGHASIERGDGSARLSERLATLRADDVATIVYTSGTTGPPRGATLTHGALLAEVSALREAIKTDREDEQLLMLPLAHILARVLAFSHVAVGSKLAFSGDAHRLMTDFEEVRPTFFASVPRFFEKIVAVATKSAHAEGPLKAALWSWALATGMEASRARRRRRKISGLLSARSRYADQLVLKRVRKSFGGKLRFAISGGAPLTAELAEWFHACGVLLLEGYGLTEAGGASHVNREHAFRFGTVGLPLPGVETRIASDGEILLRGSTLMREYRGDPDATGEALDADGFLHTGDIGRMDRDGFLTVVDRKKDLIVTAGGSKVSPQNVEGLLTSSPFIEHAAVFGEGRPYLVALLGLDLAQCTHWAEGRNRPTSRAALAADPELRALVQLDVDVVNRRLSSYETIKRFAILDTELSTSDGALTESGKLRRARVAARFADVIDSLYAS